MVHASGEKAAEVPIGASGGKGSKGSDSCFGGKRQHGSYWSVAASNNERVVVVGWQIR